MEENKNKIVYSRNEKILRVISIAAIIVSLIVGIMLFPLGKIVGGVIVLCACALSIVLVSGFFTRFIKRKFSTHKYKKAIYASIYALIMVICMLTAVIVSFFTTYPMETLAQDSISYSQKAIKELDPNANDFESFFFDYFEYNDSYYFAIETTYNSVEPGGHISERSANTYIKVNKYTATYSVIKSIEFEKAKSYTY